MTKHSPIKELDIVCIPLELARDNEVSHTGTVVSVVEGCPFLIVECSKLNSKKLYGETLLLDVPIPDLSKYSQLK